MQQLVHYYNTLITFPIIIPIKFRIEVLNLIILMVGDGYVASGNFDGGVYSICNAFIVYLCKYVQIESISFDSNNVILYVVLYFILFIPICWLIVQIPNWSHAFY